MKLARCPVHRKLVNAARDEMSTHQRFMKHSALETTGFEDCADLINWPYVRKMVEDDLGGELLQPIVEMNGCWDPEIHPEKFLPGAKRKTAGYARTSALPEKVAMLYAGRRYNSAAGSWHSFEKLALSYQKQGLPIEFHPVALPPLRLTTR